MRCWLIIPNPIDSGNAPQIAPQAVLQRAARIDFDVPPQPAQNNVRELSPKQKPSTVYLDRAAAVEAAEAYAKEHPQVPVYLFESTDAIESREPPIIQKQFNSSGELVPI